MARHRWATQSTPDLVARAPGQAAAGPGQPVAGSVRKRMPRFRIAFGAAVVCVAVLGSGTVVMYLQQPSAPIDAVQLQNRGRAGPSGLSDSAALSKETGPSQVTGPKKGSASLGDTASPGQAADLNPAVPNGEMGQDASTSRVVIVHVAGAVKNPGVVELPQGSRIYAAIDKAGGALPDAALAEINLAEVLADGEQLYVPVAGEEARRPPAGVQSPGTAVGAGPGAGPAGSGAGPGAGPGVVNINTATEAELQELPGVGPVLADRIVAWREEHGGFTTVADLDAVSGIGEVLMSSLAGLVTL